MHQLRSFLEKGDINLEDLGVSKTFIAKMPKKVEFVALIDAKTRLDDFRETGNLKKFKWVVNAMNNYPSITLDKLDLSQSDYESFLQQLLQRADLRAEIGKKSGFIPNTSARWHAKSFIETFRKTGNELCLKGVRKMLQNRNISFTDLPHLTEAEKQLLQKGNQ